MKAISKAPYFLPLLFLFLLAIASFWQIAFWEYTLKWDNADAYHPYRYFIVECIRNREFPWWNPYQFLGYPIYSDPQSGAWYPVLWLLSLFSSYSMAMMNVEFMLHIVLAAFGMFFLSRELGRSVYVSMSCAIVYMSSGLLIETAQMLPFTISLSWIPFILFFFIKTIRNRQWRWPLLLGVVLSMLVTGGYPAFTIIVCYVLFTAYVVHVFGRLRKKERKRALEVSKRLLLAMTIFLMISGGYLQAVYHALPYFSRGEGLEYNEELYSYALSIHGLLGLLMPLSETAKETLEANNFVYSYFGFFTLLTLLFFLGMRKGKFQLVVLLCSVFFFTAAMGEVFPVRKWLFYYVPGMQLFRHPVIFLVFAQLGFLINVGFAWDNLIAGLSQHRKKWLWVVGLLGLLFVMLLLCWSSFFPQRTLSKALKVVVFGEDALPWTSKVAIQSVVLSISCGLLWLGIRFVRNAKLIVVGMVVLVYVDLFMAVQLNRNRKITAKVKRALVDDALGKLPAGFPLPNLNLPLNQISDNMLNFSIPERWKNMNTYAKQTAYDGYSPFILKKYDALRQQPDYRSTLNHPLLYFSKTLEGLPDKARMLKITAFRPNCITVEVETEGAGYLTYFQSHFPGWEVTIDGETVPLLEKAVLAMGVALTPGSHLVHFQFKSNLSRFLLLLSILTLVVACFILLGHVLPKKGQYAVTLLLLLFCIIRVFAFRPFYQQQEEVLRAAEKELLSWQELSKAVIGINSDELSFLEEEKHLPVHFLRFKPSNLLGQQPLIELLDQSKKDYFVYLHDNLFEPLELSNLIRSRFPNKVKEVVIGHVRLQLYQRGTAILSQNRMEYQMNFDQEEAGWSFENGQGDTNYAYSTPCSFRMNTVSAYSPILTIPYIEDKTLFDQIDIAVKVFPQEGQQRIQLIFMVEDKHKKLKAWKSLPIGDEVSHKRGWTTCYWSLDMRSMVAPGDQIKTYVWNLGKGTFNLDNFTVSLVKTSAN
jgi:hypothetical protein